ncbi:O-antigen ligase family protein, partial [Patescibacteria group bacterium]|nr:O-antigen ligase family protein [Patescibacteria group bacterium]
ALSYLFTHLDGKSLHELYVFVRDSRLAEITLQTASDASGNVQNGLYQRFLGNSGYFYRIFMQSQFYVVALWLLLVSGSLFSWRNQRLPDIIILSLIGLSAVLILSMSRSFILGAGVGGLFLFIFSFFYGKGALKNIFKRIITFVLIGGFAFLIVWLSIEIPFPKNPDISNAAFYETSANSDRDMAVSSRWALLGPMMDEIEGSPVFGSGFGEEVTFITDDPRVREIDPSGRWTTYRFEWGWQDTWLKMGILGLLAFATYAGFMAYVLKENVKARGYRWILFGLAAGIIMLFVAHTFSPYLNHPIGLVMMMLPIPFLEFDKIKKPELHAKEKLEKLQLQSAKQNVAVNRE